MRRLFALAVACALVASVAITPLAAAAGRGVLVGTAKNYAGQVLADHIVQLRTLASGAIVASMKSSASGEYRFAGLDSGRYAVEVLSPAGQVIGTTAANVSSGTSSAGVAAVSSSAALGAWLASAAAGAGTAAIGSATIHSVTGAASSAGVSALVGVRPNPSASK